MGRPVSVLWLVTLAAVGKIAAEYSKILDADALNGAGTGAARKKSGALDAVDRLADVPFPKAAVILGGLKGWFKMPAFKRSEWV